MENRLTEVEKIYFRAMVIQKKMNSQPCTVEEDLRRALIKANSNKKYSAEIISQKLKKAKRLKRDCFSRYHKPCAWVPAHFGASCFTGSDRISQESLSELQVCFKKHKKVMSTELGNRIPNSSAAIWRVTDYKFIKGAIKEAKQLLMSVIAKKLCNLKSRESREKEIRKYLKKMSPTEVDFIEYKKGQTQGAAWHDDGYCVFGTVVIVLQDSIIGRLHIEGLDLPECFEPGDVAIIDPTKVHKVTTALRETDRVTATFVF